jgi:hypothetical protein
LYIFIFKFLDSKVEKKDIFGAHICFILSYCWFWKMSFTFPCPLLCNVFVSNVFFFTRRFKSSRMLLSVEVKFPDVSKYYWRPGFNPKSVHVEFVVDKVTLRQAFLRVLWFSTVTILFIHLSPMLCIVSFKLTL